MTICLKIFQLSRISLSSSRNHTRYGISGSKYANEMAVNRRDNTCKSLGVVVFFFVESSSFAALIQKYPPRAFSAQIFLWQLLLLFHCYDFFLYQKIGIS